MSRAWSIGEKPLGRGSCWMAFATRDKTIKSRDGSLIRFQPFSCPIALRCIDRFSRIFFLEETARLTEKGLVTEPNPLGTDLMLEFLGEYCRHPEKRKILAHVASLEPLGVLIPWDVLRVIEKYGEG